MRIKHLQNYSQGHGVVTFLVNMVEAQKSSAWSKLTCAGNVTRLEVRPSLKKQIIQLRLFQRMN